MNNPMAKITRLEGEKRQSLIRPANRLISTEKLMRRYYHGIPLGQDLVGEQNAINAWATVTVCYSGIEQAIKFLLKIQENLDEVPRNYKHHRIGALFQELTEEQREVVRESYSIYQSLHDYIELKTVDDFLGEIDSGYPAWRYFPLEGISPPTTHCGAMLEIWFALANIIEARVFKNHGLYHCGRRFCGYLTKCLNEALYQFVDQTIDSEDLNRCVGAENHLLNSWASILRRYAIGANKLGVLPSTKSILLASIDNAKKRAQSDQDFSQFLDRAQNPGITWNHRKKRFETP